MASRRLFLGSVAAAGVGAVGATTLNFPVSAQPAATGPFDREIRRQLKDAFSKLQFGAADEGARQAATTLRIYAATLNDAQYRALLRKANRLKLLSVDMNHAEMERAADELGVQKSLLRHSTNFQVREEMLDRMLKEGLSPFMREVADAVEAIAPKLQLYQAQVRRVVLQPIPSPGECGDCERACGLVEAAIAALTAACALMAVFPPAAELCAAASFAYLTALVACGSCQAIIAFCRSYNL
jgi:hypothetical protein